MDVCCSRMLAWLPFSFSREACKDPKGIKRTMTLSTMCVWFLSSLAEAQDALSKHQWCSWLSLLPFCFGAKVKASARFAYNRLKKEQNSKGALPARFAFPPSRHEACGKLFVKLNLVFLRSSRSKTRGATITASFPDYLPQRGSNKHSLFVAAQPIHL